MHPFDLLPSSPKLLRHAAADYLEEKGDIVKAAALRSGYDEISYCLEFHRDNLINPATAYRVDGNPVGDGSGYLSGYFSGSGRGSGPGDGRGHSSCEGTGFVVYMDGRVTCSGVSTAPRLTWSGRERSRYDFRVSETVRNMTDMALDPRYIDPELHDGVLDW